VIACLQTTSSVAKLAESAPGRQLDRMLQSWLVAAVGSWGKVSDPAPGSEAAQTRSLGLPALTGQLTQKFNFIASCMMRGSRAERILLYFALLVANDAQQMGLRWLKVLNDSKRS